MASDFEDEVWDEDFLDKLVKAEELAMTTSATQPQPHPSYSPPRELSQRVHVPPAALSRGQGIHCFPSSSISISESTKEPKIAVVKDKKEKRMKFLPSNIDLKETENIHAKTNFSHYIGRVADDHVTVPDYQKSRSLDEMSSFTLNIRSKGVGVQTDDIGESDNSQLRNDIACHQKKLLGIWELDGEKSEKCLALKLFEACGTDFPVLSGYLSSSLPSKTATESSLPKSDWPSPEFLRSARSADDAKISHLFLLLNKISSEMVRMEDLLEALIECCRLKNGVIVYSSLRILHVVLMHTSRMQKKPSHRVNVMFTGPLSDNILEDMHDLESFESRNLHYPSAKTIAEKFDLHGASCLKATKNSIISTSANVDWFSLFELLNQIVMADFDELVRLEAISIMNMILLSCKAYSEREKFASKLVLQTVSLLLKKEAGFYLQKQAVNLFYLLLNCPKVTTAFCVGSMEDDDGALRAEVDAKIISSVQELRMIVHGLVDCLLCTGNCSKKLKLRRCTITVIAYIASLGKAGLGILLNQRLPQRRNILVSILESLISDLDLETLDTVQSFEVLRERTLLIREALILLNRLVSHPQFSTSVLQALTSGRDITSLTVNTAKRLCYKGKLLWQDDHVTKQIRESEIPELARLFNRRVVTFLADNVP